MRLVCPNCDAKYEVPEDAIPETGRDVQCANCGHAWFQMRRATEAAPVAAAVVAPLAAPVPTAPPAPEPVVEMDVPEPAEVEPDPEPEPVSAPEVEIVAEPTADVAMTEAPVAEAAAVADHVPVTTDVEEPVVEAAAEALVVAGESVVAESEVVDIVESPLADDLAAAVDAVDGAVARPTDEPVVQADLVDETDEEPVDLPASTGAIAAAGVAAYAVDDSVLAILREEAEREAHARKAEVAKPLETQTDLGLDAAMTASRKAAVAEASDLVSGDETPEDRTNVRRTRLPDVEEINSTLRPSEVAEVEAAGIAPVADGRSSFRSGFLLVMTLAILASALYGSADAIASAVPALEGPLRGFVGFVDSLRLQLDGLMQSATVAIDGN
jgi:resuscitation-promoting factor RpfA